MRKFFPIHLLMLGLALSFPAAAQESAGDVESIPVDTGEDTDYTEELSATYSTIGLSMVNADFDNVKSAVNLDSTIIGLRVPTFPWIGIELNASLTMIPGQVDSPNCGGLGGPTCPDNIAQSNTDFVAHMFGVYGVVRTPGTLFGMGKVGYRYLNSLPEFEDERSGSAWAIGGGYRWAADSFVEVSYHKLHERLDSFGLTFSYSYDR